jgi:polysaccharide export outer membrane protein
MNIIGKIPISVRESGLSFLLPFTLLIACAAAAQTSSGTPQLEVRRQGADRSGVGIIGSGDVIRVSILDTPDLSGEFRIGEDGTARLPLIGEIYLSHHTEQEAASLIDRAYESGLIVRRPNATVFITAYSATGVTVVGEVTKPGIYSVSGSRSLLDLVALAGGFTPLADSEVYVQSSDGSRKTFELPPDKALRDLDDSIKVAPGDKIVVERAGSVYVLGAVGRPGTYVMQHNGNLTVLQALAEAGGSLRIAGESHAVLLRPEDDYRPQVLSLHDMYTGKRRDIPLRSQDILYVPNSLGKDLIVNLPQIIGTLAGAAIYSINVSH